MKFTNKRQSKVEEALALVRVATEKEISGEQLAQVCKALAVLATQRTLWFETAFLAPETRERQVRYQIAQDGPPGLTLNLNVMRPGKRIPLHNHTTWACIAAVEGEEINTLWERLDDGTVTGQARLCESEKIIVGTKVEPAILLMADDIHDDRIIRHLHLYGRPLETLAERTTFDPENGTCRPMEGGVKTLL